LPATHCPADVQQPVQDVVSQAQCPPEQWRPVPHAGPLPHVHAPADEHPSPVVPQPWQALPPVPHAGPVGGEVQTLPVQHPLPQDVSSHTQVPIEQRCPAPHAPPAPHRQTPVGEQLSAVDELHAVQPVPSVPQVPKPEVVQLPLESQQPFGHDVELQTQVPLEQICPASHGAPVPHLQAPPVQRSAVVDEHVVHAAPPVPHVPIEGVSHVAPTQHPLVHVVLHPVHAWFTQFSVLPQAPHAEPPLPHALLEVPTMHVVPEQHPFGHDVPLHTQAPLTHA
jgi:hypothetical protein